MMRVRLGAATQANIYPEQGEVNSQVCFSCSHLHENKHQTKALTPYYESLSL